MQSHKHGTGHPSVRKWYRAEDNAGETPAVLGRCRQDAGGTGTTAGIGPHTRYRTLLADTGFILKP